MAFTRLFCFYSTRLPLLKEATFSQRCSFYSTRQLYSTRLGTSTCSHTPGFLRAQASTKLAACFRVELSHQQTMKHKNNTQLTNTETQQKQQNQNTTKHIPTIKIHNKHEHSQLAKKTTLYMNRTPKTTRNKKQNKQTNTTIVAHRSKSTT